MVSQYCVVEKTTCTRGSILTITDSVVSRCGSGQKAVTRSAYLLFYRRRTPVPLGPPELQKIVQSAESDPAADSEADDDDNNRSRPRNSDSGNGRRLDASSRNGSSSAFTAGTGVAAGAGVLHGGGSHQHSGRGSLPRNAAGVANLSDDDEDDSLLHTNDGAADSQDEGFVDAEDLYQRQDQYGTYADDMGPVWSFEGIGSSSLQQNRLNDSDDVASDTPNLGSDGGEELGNRLLEDFGDDIVGSHPGVSTPVEGIEVSMAGDKDDGDVHEIRVLGE
jgi:ubiquitin carboxyl-terminal hydrolase 4/11/15